jgi:hypothetical protein
MSGELIAVLRNVVDSKVIFTSLNSSSMMATFVLDKNGKKVHKSFQGQFIVELTGDTPSSIDLNG